MNSGTWEDKVSALTLMVQESPLHNMKAFENLLGLARKRSRDQALLAIQAIKDLLAQGVVLPSERKLRPFAKQPGLLSSFQGNAGKWKAGDALPGGLEKVHLITWSFEDWLKKLYFSLLTIIEGWCNDEVEYSRKRAINFVFELLRDKPEQEENLLRLLVNKLGDKEKRVASRASYLLLQLEIAHPAMKAVIIGSIEADLLFKPSQTVHSKYYATITLNQTVLTAKEQHTANRLLAVYFSLFVTLLKAPENQKSSVKPSQNGHVQGGGGIPGKKARQKAKAAEKAKEASITADQQARDRLISQVLTGVNRAYPFANTEDSEFEKHVDTMFRITHSANFNTSIQALLLIQQISSAKHYSADRFYRTLYESLLDPRLIGSSKQIMYLNLLYKALKSDVNIKRVQAFVKRLVQVLNIHEPPFICSVLFMISELENTFPSIRGMFNQAEENDAEAFVDGPLNAPSEGRGQGLGSGDSNNRGLYDPRKRDPSHSNAHRSCLWEILPFLQHHHPSVPLFAKNLIQSLPPPTKPDPTHYTLIHFLDRFAYRNAKTKAPAPKGESIMQPLSGVDTADRLIGARDRGKLEAPLNSENFWQKKVQDVPADEVFFHQYFEQTGMRKEAAAKKKEKRLRTTDAEGDLSDEDEDEIWQALVNSRPDVEGDEDDDFDDDAEGFDAEDMESDGEAEDLDKAGELSVDTEDEELEDGFPDEEVDLGLKQRESLAGAADGEDDEVPDFDDPDAEAFVGSDSDLPSDFEHFSEEETAGKANASEAGSKNKERRAKKRKLKSLPTFASADDYAKYLGSDEE
jgi:ribosome biogenesis protein MAK21